MTKINNIFFTRICWECVGGVSGFAMTLRDNGKSQVKLCGPSNLPDFINATRFFLYHESLDFDCVGFTGNNEEKFEDDNLIIWPVVINGRWLIFGDLSVVIFCVFMCVRPCLYVALETNLIHTNLIPAIFFDCKATYKTN